MRVKVKAEKGEMKGTVVGVTYSGDVKKTCLIVVQLDGRGMVCDMFHPTALTPLKSPAPIINQITEPVTEKVDIPPAPEDGEEEEAQDGSADGKPTTVVVN